MKRMRLCVIAIIGLGLLFGFSSTTAADSAAIAQTVESAIKRLKTELPEDKLLHLRSTEVAQWLTDAEKAVLGEQFLSFEIDRPATVYVVVDPELEEDLFWLPAREFERTNMTVPINFRKYRAWAKDFDAGTVGLGISTFHSARTGYFVAVVPQAGSGKVTVSNIVPSTHETGVVKKRALAFPDRPDSIMVKIPKELAGQFMIAGDSRRCSEAHIQGRFHKTPRPASETPDQVVLMITEDPSTTQMIQWRTSTKVADGAVFYQERGSEKVTRVAAETNIITDVGLLNDPKMNQHSALLTGLKPSTTYTYYVGDAAGKQCSATANFTTGPAKATDFSFIYMGDVQVNYDAWEALLDLAKGICPQPAFCIMAGDQVNAGGQRDEWDLFFHAARNFFNTIPFAPTVGNHEMYCNTPFYYLQELNLPENGPKELTAERAYSFTYGQALFVVLDGNASPQEQAPWLKQQLEQSNATWKCVLFHQPIYSSKPNRDNPHLRKAWVPLFDEYGVDVVFQGHDHGYLRTKPIRAGEQEEGGTTYLVTVAGTKYYDIADRSYAVMTRGNTSTFQIIDVRADQKEFHYRAYNAEGDELDEFTLKK